VHIARLKRELGPFCGGGRHRTALPALSLWELWGNRMPIVESSAILRISYNETSRRLYVTFRETGKTYAYHGVPKATYEDLLQAESIGAYFNAFIKDRYPFTEGSA
jgi:hypothetical protein